jgi:hypothetical protein
MGLVPMSELGKLCKVETPIMDMVIGLTSYLLQRDFKAEGRNLKRLGVESMGKEELLTYLKYKGADR